MRFNPIDQAEEAGKAWAEQFDAEGDPQTLERLREMVANAYSAGWLEGCGVGFAEAGKVIRGESNG